MLKTPLRLGAGGDVLLIKKHISSRTTFHAVWLFLGGLGVLVSVGFVSVLLGQGPASPSRPASAKQDPSFTQDVQPFLAKNCYACHNEKLSTANLSLSAFTSAELAERKPEVWDKVLEKLSTGKMPPPGRPVPAKTEIAGVTRWIEGTLARAGFSR